MAASRSRSRWPTTTPARVVRITEQGRAALARATAVLERCDAAWARRVGPERYRVFREVLAEVALG